MTILWLIVWVVYGTPELHPWNSWLVALVICGLLDLTGGGRRAAH